MGAIDQAQQYREDFMKNGEKGGAHDPMMRQQPQLGRKLSHEEITNIYANDQIIQNIVDIPAEDCTREWITLNIEDEKLKNEIENKLRQLRVQEGFQNMVSYDRLRGDGFISIGLTERKQFDLKDPVELPNVKSVDYLHPFSSKKVSQVNVNDDVFSAEFGDVRSYLITSSSQAGEQEVHRNRLIHLQTQRLESMDWGQSILEPMFKYITMFDTASWSVGQILYDYVFKIFSTSQADGMDTQEKNDTQMLLDFMFRTEALAIIGEDEELKKEATNVSGIQQLLDYTWETLAGAARMPKSHILGQQAGTISGAQYDTLNYYARIAGIQENYLRPKLEYLVRLILASDEFGNLDPDSVDWSLKFNPLWKMDSQTEADIRKKVAETDAIYMKWGSITPDEVREKRFSGNSLSAELNFNEDEMKEVDKIIQDHGDQDGET